ncbi:glycosyltransferase involved in cell wall biosynthesis [Kineococcus radiotolerans]|uniref:Glycosyltransferase involved in cell wall biosynthesis n=1 Tax=Kineococcus radiotolerans TaxID=131568 RepID=A0A7W4TPC6_KINRA|nr:glycosyltransferase family 4 protein [Kineococcus radiotolerans]MBB2901991.1 glycosyltransferase involved in cell wall biosynthesis [Kineococcus radiotolerans]
MSGEVGGALRGLRLAVLFPGDATDPTVRSGTPYGVLQGLRGWGVDVVPVDVRPGARAERLAAAALAPLHRGGGAGRPVRERFRRGYSAALVGSHLAAGRTLTGQRRLDRLEGLHGVVQLGGGYEVRTALPRVVYDDMTVAQALRYPYVNWETMRRGDVESRLALQRRVYRSATTCCMTSSWAADSAEDDYGVPAERVRVVGAGTHEPPRTPVRDFSTPRFLFVGLDFTRKNGPRVLEAFARLRAEQPAATLDVVGGHPPISAPGVRTHGRIPRNEPAGRARLQALFDGATCFVMPSLYEPAGVVFTEAAAAGLPSIGGSNGGSADFIGDGGAVVDPTDTDAVLEAMRRFSDPVRAAETGARAAARSPLFTWSSLAARLVRGLELGGPFTADDLDLPGFLPRRPQASHSG